MKGKKPTRRQKIIIKKRRLNPSNWLVLKNPVNELHIQNILSKKTKVLKYERR